MEAEVMYTELINTERQKIMPVVFVIDASASMKKMVDNNVIIDCINRILEALNQEMDIVVPDRVCPYEGIDHITGKPSIQYAILSYNSLPKWLTDGFEDYCGEVDKNIRFEGLSDLGLALNELNHRLSVHAFLNDKRIGLLPIIFVISDGICTDDYENALENLKTNIWFEHATKVSIGVTKCSDLHKSLVGKSEGYFDLDDICSLLEILPRIPLQSISMMHEYYDEVLEPSDYLKRELRWLDKRERVSCSENKESDLRSVDSDWDDPDWD